MTSTRVTVDTAKTIQAIDNLTNELTAVIQASTQQLVASIDRLTAAVGPQDLVVDALNPAGSDPDEPPRLPGS